VIMQWIKNLFGSYKQMLQQACKPLPFPYGGKITIKELVTCFIIMAGLIIAYFIICGIIIGVIAIIPDVFLFLLAVWLLISPLFWVYWFFYPKALDRFSVNHKIICWVIGIGAFLGCWVVIGGGLERILWFVPADWGYHNEEGEFRLMRTSIAGIISFFMAVFIAYLFAEVRKLRREIKERENQVEGKMER